MIETPTYGSVFNQTVINSLIKLQNIPVLPMSICVKGSSVTADNILIYSGLSENEIYENEIENYFNENYYNENYYNENYYNKNDYNENDHNENDQNENDHNENDQNENDQNGNDHNENDQNENDHNENDYIENDYIENDYIENDYIENDTNENNNKYEKNKLDLDIEKVKEEVPQINSEKCLARLKNKCYKVALPLDQRTYYLEIYGYDKFKRIQAKKREFLANRIYANLIYLLLLADHIDGKACGTVVGDMKALLHRDMLENDKTTQGIVKDTKELFVSEVFDPGIDKNLKNELFVSEVFDPGGKIN